MASPVTIDGSRGEGGGQILRSSLALSLLTGRPVQFVRIRAGRQKSGLQPQHLMSVRAAARVGCAAVTGDEKGSQELSFEPGPVAAGHFRFDIGTAGATALVMQTVHLPLALRGGAASTVVVTGGTHVMKAPSASFLIGIWQPWLAQLDLRVRVEMKRPGFYPRGGGVLEAHVQAAAAVRPLELLEPAARGRKVQGFAAVAGLPEEIAARMAKRAHARLAGAGIAAQIELQSWEGGPGAVIGLFEGSERAPALFVGLGERGKQAERVADDAVDQLLEHRTTGGLDEHLADQLVLPLAFAPGRSEFAVAKVTRHLITNVETVRLFLERDIRIEGSEGDPGRVIIEGS